ncbi:YceD family protein [Oxalobacter vibrioformis]|uniref:Large ribosomal RNA subunit accumulation protein YceD n=1 Tax=Oxalobacter vibrioformis TaxID=933080 RepID=A0A9E9LZU2_9BURK|nr:YceD family protein [Oxalobacter vibrioformis]WAW10645.1 YceD family protein [Oxalobacter vibrioformis]
MDAVLDDPGEFCRKNQQREGRVKVADLERLSVVCASKSGELQWAVTGRISPSGHSQLDLTVKGRIDLICQRCLEAFSFDLDSRAAIILAGSEEAADEIEDALDDDDPTEVIVGGEKIDILVLVEDEVLLTIPLSPRHDICPDTSRLVFGEKRESPFAVLKNLKTDGNKKN